jgi:hypothetical protein
MNLAMQFIKLSHDIIDNLYEFLLKTFVGQN